MRSTAYNSHEKALKAKCDEKYYYYYLLCKVLAAKITLSFFQIYREPIAELEFRSRLSRNSICDACSYFINFPGYEHT